MDLRSEFPVESVLVVLAWARMSLGSVNAMGWVLAAPAWSGMSLLAASAAGLAVAAVCWSDRESPSDPAVS